MEKDGLNDLSEEMVNTVKNEIKKKRWKDEKIFRFHGTKIKNKQMIRDYKFA